MASPTYHRIDLLHLLALKKLLSFILYPILKVNVLLKSDEDKTCLLRINLSGQCFYNAMNGLRIEFV